VVANEVHHQNIELLFSQGELYLNAICLDFDQITSLLQQLNKVDRWSKKIDLFWKIFNSKKLVQIRIG